MIPTPAALLFTANPRRMPNFTSDTFRLLPTLEQALIDEPDDGRRADGRRPDLKSGKFRLLPTLGH